MFRSIRTTQLLAFKDPDHQKLGKAQVNCRPIVLISGRTMMDANYQTAVVSLIVWLGYHFTANLPTLRWISFASKPSSTFLKK
jgi:hypothetical protein